YAIDLLEPPGELLPLPGDDVELVVGQLAPLFLHLALELLPVPLHAIPVHLASAFVIRTMRHVASHVPGAAPRHECCIESGMTRAMEAKVKSILALGLGIAVVGLARFFVTAIVEEHRRREALRDEHEALRWESEGGNPVTSLGALAEM